MIPYTVYGPSVNSIAAGLHQDDDVVTVTGLANGREMKTTASGAKWAAFELIAGNTAVRLLVPAEIYATSGDQLDPVIIPGVGLRPSNVRVTGRLDQHDIRPALIAQKIARITDGEPVAIPEPDVAAPQRVLRPDDGISVDEAIAMLRGGAR